MTTLFEKSEVDKTVEGIFGGMHMHNASASAQSIPTGAAYTAVTAYTDTDATNMGNGVAYDNTTKELVFTEPGYFVIIGGVSFTGTGVNKEWFLAAFLDGVERDDIHFQRKISTGGDIGSAPLAGIITITSTTPVRLSIRARHNDGGALDLTVTYSNIIAFKIGTYQA